MKEVFDKARKFIYLNARPLEFALWKYHFENGTADEVLSVLSAFQNEDGGFGHGLEADSLNPNSSHIQTWCATAILRQIDFYNPDHHIVSGIIRSLTSGTYFDGHCWEQTVPSSNDYPGAPWWNYTPPIPSEKRSYNPTAALAGFIVRAGKPGSDASDLGKRIACEAFDYYMSHDTEVEKHLLPCYIDLCDDVRHTCPDLFDWKVMYEKLCRDAAECVRRDADKWHGNYCAHPSDLLSGPFPELKNAFPELAEAECDFIAETQLESGAWPILWDWGAYPDEFAVSANWWKAHLVVKNMLYLKRMEKF